MSFRIFPAALDPQALKQALQCDRAGACVCFEGWVRDHNEGEAVRALEYEAHEPIAVAEGRAILEEARRRFGLFAADACHRVGRLEIGDCAVWVGVSAAHRGEAFEACRYVIDEIKRRLPIWKKEHYRDGQSGWVNCATAAAPARRGLGS